MVHHRVLGIVDEISAIAVMPSFVNRKKLKSTIQTRLLSIDRIFLLRVFHLFVKSTLQNCVHNNSNDLYIQIDILETANFVLI